MSENKTLCIVVPYRNRKEHLYQFLPHMCKTLDEQKLDYHILIVEQEDGKPFNRAKLLNVGFVHTQEKYDNYCFHDVDMLPLVSDYSYCSVPTHLAAEAEQFGYKLPYNEYFGGVTLFDRESYKKINGYANEYWGWGAEDDDIFKRCAAMGISRRRKNCRFKSLSHDRVINPLEYQKNIELLKSFDSMYDSNGFKDGLTTLKYSLLSSETIGEKTEKIIVSI